MCKIDFVTPSPFLGAFKMRSSLTAIATLLAASTAFAQMQSPTTPPRLRKTAQATRRSTPRTTTRTKTVTTPVTKKKVIVPAPAASVPVAAPAAAPAPEAKTQTLMESHLQIRYFAEVIGPNLGNTKGLWDYPDNITDNGNYDPDNAGQDTDPVNSWNQISFRWKVSDKYHAFINPRFTVQHGSTNRIRRANETAAAAGRKTSDDGMFRNEDWLVGMQGVAWANAETGWSFFIRPGYRLPTSRATRNSGWMGQLEWFHSIDWAGKDWGFGMWHQIRLYVPSYHDPLRGDFNLNSASNQNERHRQYIALYSTYKLTDTVKAEVYYENQVGHNFAKGDKSYFSYKRTRQQQTANFGVSFPVNPSLSLYPFVRAYQLGTFDVDTMGYGLWIMAALY